MRMSCLTGSRQLQNSLQLKYFPLPGAELNITLVYLATNVEHIYICPTYNRVYEVQCFKMCLFSNTLCMVEDIYIYIMFYFVVI